jgi:hypothetical protein
MKATCSNILKTCPVPTIVIIADRMLFPDRMFCVEML